MRSGMRLFTGVGILALTMPVHAEYFVVLGVYQDRDVVVREFKMLGDASLFVNIDRNPQRTRYQIVEGPYPTEVKALDSRRTWLAKVPQAWVTALNPALPDTNLRSNLTQSSHSE